MLKDKPEDGEERKYARLSHEMQVFMLEYGAPGLLVGEVLILLPFDAWSLRIH